MKKLLFRVLSLGVSTLGGVLAAAIFKRTWKLVAHEEEAPRATDPDHGWRQILTAAAFQGAIFAVVKAALDRGAAESARKLTGDWPQE